MMKLMFMLTVLMLVNRIYGNPTSTAVTKDDSLVLAKPRGIEWISLQSSWKLPSFPSLSSFFGDNAAEKVELELMKKKIDSLERMQVHIIQFVKENCKGGAKFWDENSQPNQSIISTNHENHSNEVWQITSQTSESTAIDQSATVDTNSRISSTQPETSVLTSSGNPITSLPAKPIEQPTTQNSNKVDSGNTNVNSKTDHDAPTISQLEEENKSAEISSTFGSLDELIQRRENGRTNGRLP